MALTYKSRTTVQFKLSVLLLYAAMLGTKLLSHHWQHPFITHTDSKFGSADTAGFSLDSTDAVSEYDFRRHLLAMKVIRPPPESNCTPLAMDNFPKDLFTQSLRQKGAVILHIIGSLYMFIALAILCDDYFIPCLECICETLHLQPDVAGATFMAAGSSAPELATTLVGVFIAKDDIGLGAVVGSADFNVMLVVSVTALFAKSVIYLNWWPLIRDSSFYLVSIVILALVIIDELVYWYEAFILVIFYLAYVALMYFNPKLDHFWHVWCHNHPTFCPRAIHTEVEEQEILQQHSGAFACPAKEPDGSTTPAHVLKYERLSSIDAPPQTFSVVASDVPPVRMDPVLQFESVRTENSASITDLETQIATAELSWLQTCFEPLRLPRSRGVRGKLHYTACLFVLPIRIVLCLTIPDVRKPRWRRIAVSQWISFVVCCVWIGVFTVFMMWMITIIGVTFHVPDTIMGLTFIAAGSSVPDAIASLLVVREGEGDMAVSNAIGSNVFDILICMGLPWFLKCVISGAPVAIYSKGLLYSVLTLFSTVIFLVAATHVNRWRLTKPYGMVLLVGYFVVLIFCSCYELNLMGTVHLPECPLAHDA